jgi:hypothetical protein
VNIAALGVFALLAVIASPAQDDASVKARFGVAAGWLTQLCVLKGGTFESLDLEELAAAFVAWENDTTDVDKCNAASSTSQKQPPSPHVAVDVSALRLNAWQRVARMGQFQVDIQQTPDYVYGVLQGQPSSTPSRFLPDPEHAIVSLGGPLFLNELYVGADTRVGVCSALDLKALHADDPCFDPLYVEARRVRDNVLRVTAAMALNINFSQVPRYQSQVVLTSLQSFGVPEWSKTITGSFDPSMLFRSMNEKKALAGYAGQLADALSAAGGSFVPVSDKVDGTTSTNKFTRDTIVQDLCDSEKATTQKFTSEKFTDNCIARMTIGGTTQRLVISLLPVINVKVTSPFDLAKYGTNFIAPPGKAGQSLYDVTLTWNLRNLIPSASSRLDAYNAAAALAKPATAPASPADQMQQKQTQWKRTVAKMYIELKGIPTRSLDEEWWARFESLVIDKN